MYTTDGQIDRQMDGQKQRLYLLPYSRGDNKCNREHVKIRITQISDYLFCK